MELYIQRKRRNANPPAGRVAFIQPGQSQFVEPNAEGALVDGTQYAVTVTAGQPISVVVNTHRDEGVSTPVMYSVNGYAAGASAP